MIETIKNFIKDENLIGKNETIVVGVSKTDNIYFTISAFIAGCLLGYGVNSQLIKH